MSDIARDVVIGEIVASFGLKGEVKVLPHTDFPERFERLGEVFVAGEGAPGRMMKIEGVRPHKGCLLVKFAGVNDISGAEMLRGAKLRIQESELLPLDENEYYVHDIVGLEVVTTDGESLGTIKEVLRSPANDVYVTDRAMIPAVKKYVRSIDLNAKRIIVGGVEGLVQEQANED